jgi:hypothetical protein
MSELYVSPYSYQERLLVSPSSPILQKAAATESSLTATVRVEAFAEWKSTAFIQPIFDFLSKKNHPLIHKVHMSIASQATQSFPLASYNENENQNPNNGLDHVPRLLQNSQQFLSMPQGFFLVIEPKRDVTGISPYGIAAAVNAVLEDLIRTRLLTTPITGAAWDIREQKIINIPHNNNYKNRNHTGSDNADGDYNEDDEESIRLSYELFLPLNGAAWSSDAIQQSLSKTIPQVCHTKTIDGDEITFFGWSSQQWSNFLVGNINDIDDDNKEGNKKILKSHFPLTKQMWWTWTSSPTLSSSDEVHYMNFGIEYQVDLGRAPFSHKTSTWRDWLPPPFLDENSRCPIASRTMYEVTDTHYWKPLDRKIDESDVQKQVSRNILNYPYRASLDQVLRRHHTNRGRFEAWIEMNRLMKEEDTNCQFIYRQVFPNFFSPVWQSLSIDARSNDSNDEVGKRIFASVKWIPEDGTSILHVHGFTNGHELPSKIVISLEYDPSFLTLDDFPGDPNRGRELPPAHMTIHCMHSSQGQTSLLNPVSVYSNTLLVLPPVPDMSMPFNVISLTSSFYAYLIGTLVTILVRRGSEKIKYKLYPNKKPESKWKKLKQRITDKISKLGMYRKSTTTVVANTDAIPQDEIDSSTNKVR